MAHKIIKACYELNMRANVILGNNLRMEQSLTGCDESRGREGKEGITAATAQHKCDYHFIY